MIKVGGDMLNLEVPWSDFKKIHVIRMLRTLISNWWKLQVYFYDASGSEKGPWKAGKTCKRLLEVDSVSQLTCIEHGRMLISPIKHGKSSYGWVVVFDTKASLTDEEAAYVLSLLEVIVAEIILVCSDLVPSQKEVKNLRQQLQGRYSFAEIVGKSKPMQELYAITEKVSKVDVNVIINGENGTGKELVARALHWGSPRKEGPFLAVNCAAFNDNLLESELFGHVKGSFTGAVNDHDGLFVQANKGTLFLDEIGDTSLTMQSKLLRVLQEQEVTPMGASASVSANARIVCATNRNLKEMVKSKEFREDLYYRLNVIKINVPPLRERKEDIPLLIDHFLTVYAKKFQQKKKSVESSVLKILIDYHWPGNVRQLENEIERICVLSSESDPLTKGLLSDSFQNIAPEKLAYPNEAASMRVAVEALETKLIRDALEEYRWNKTKSANVLGISRAGLIAKIEKYGLAK